MRVAIIGAGAAGLAAARQVAAVGIECEVLEMASELGGTWVYTDYVGKDQYGFPVYSAMYQQLRTNAPKQLMSYPDFAISEEQQSFLTHTEVLEFLNDYADHFKIRDFIKFNRMVVEVRPLENKWQIKSVDKSTKKELVDVYDYVMVCNGHFNKPRIPKLPGQNIFKGKVLHSHQYRSADPFTNLSVLVIGGGPSGFDLVCHIALVAQRVVLSHHNKFAENTKFPSNVIAKPDVVGIKGEEVEFADNSSSSFDAIVYCTGYKYDFPFLHSDCGITVDNNHVQPLYKHMVHIEKPTMCFIGIPYAVCTSRMFDLQARFYCKYLTGGMSLPTQEEMWKDTNKDMQNRWTKGYEKKKAHFMGPDQQCYYDDLAIIVNIASIPPVFSKLWDESIKRLFTDFENFREDVYRIIDNECFLRVL